MANASAQLVALPAVVDLDALEDVRDRLLAAMASGPVTVSGAAVERVTTNALLMLVSAAESSRRNTTDFAIEAPSKPMQVAIERLGFSEHFAEMMRG
jgi:anti-anti-sigma regulatory factor